MSSNEKESTSRTLQGTVVSDKMEQTVVVRIVRKVKHPLYGKVMTRSTKLSVHDKDNQGKVGDTVLIRECRPISKTKTHTLVDVIEKAR